MWYQIADQRGFIANTIILKDDKIESLIFTIRGVQVMLDSDLAELYNVEVKRLNDQVKKNILRFPVVFDFNYMTMNLGNWSQIATSLNHINIHQFDT